MSAHITDLASRRKKMPPCPQCGTPALAPHTPFCSRRCAQIDLGKWLNEDYRIAAHEANEDENLEEMLEQADKDTPLS